MMEYKFCKTRNIKAYIIYSAAASTQALPGIYSLSNEVFKIAFSSDMIFSSLFIHSNLFTLM